MNEYSVKFPPSVTSTYFQQQQIQNAENICRRKKTGTKEKEQKWLIDDIQDSLILLHFVCIFFDQIHNHVT